MDNPATAGEHLRQLRRQAKLSQLDLALITGVSQRHLSCLETGRAKPSPGTLIPADDATWQVMRAAYGENAALVL